MHCPKGVYTFRTPYATSGETYLERRGAILVISRGGEGRFTQLKPANVVVLRHGGTSHAKPLDFRCTRTFTGDSTAQILSAVLRDDPEIDGAAGTPR